MFLGFNITEFIFVMKIIGFILSLCFAVILVLYLLKQQKNSAEGRARFDAHFIRYEKEESPQQKRWYRIRDHFQSHNPAEWRMAIIDADAMLEDLITKLGYRGDSFGEKLKSMNAQQFPLLQIAWNVHKLRNVLAHQGSAYPLTEREAYQAFKDYEHIFFETGYIT